MFSKSVAEQLLQAINSLSSKEKSECGSFSYGKYLMEVMDNLTYPVLNEVLDFCAADRCVLISLTPETVIQVPMKLERDLDSSVSEMDVTGCPLETSYNPNQTLFDTTLLGSAAKTNCSLNSDRVPLAKEETSFVFDSLREIFTQTQSQHSQIPIAILCDATDCENTLIKGLHLTGDTFKRFKVKCDIGKLYSTNHLPKLELFENEHSRMICGQKIRNSSQAIFDAMEGGAQHPDDLDSTSRIRLVCRWNDNSGQQSLTDPSAEASCVLHASIFLGDETSAAKLLCQELMVLNDLVERLQSEESWVAAGEVKTETNFSFSTEDKVSKLIERVKTRSNKSDAERSTKSRANSDPDAKELFEFAHFPARVRQDFIDQLWSTLKDCTSLDELQNCLTLVFECTESSSMKPVIFPHNKTTIGNILMDIQRNKIKAPAVSSLQPLNLLIEMGIRKMQQDYLDLFLASNLVTKDSLLPLVKLDGHKNPAESFDCLVKLHMVAELVAMCSRISASHNFLSKCARAAFQQIGSLEHNESRHSFVIPVERSMVESVFERYSPSVWNLRLNSENRDYKIQNSFHLTAGHPLDAGYHNTCGKSNEVQYLLSVATGVSDIRF